MDRRSEGLTVRGLSGKLHLGNLVVLPNRLGIGRVGQIDSTQVRVDYFDSAGTPVCESLWVDRKACKPVVLERETRIFWQDPEEGYWRAGRVVGHDGDRYYVRPPNTDSDIIVPERDVRVRWDRPAKDPVDTLLAGANETPYFRDARLPLLESLITQRGACAGATALLSSAVEIHPHQVKAALTVLSDPVQRYLLADEVGLGKTIEAGFVIRQTLLDDPGSRVVIIAPDALRRQWNQELITKFHIDDFPGAVIKISAHENPAGWKDYHGFDLVVIDEADQLVEVADPKDSPYREVQALAHSCPKLLLLSATPATRRLNTHLGLLHLLDKDLYKWEDREAFRARFEQRKELANHLYALTAEEGFEVLLPAVIDDILALTPDDVRLAALADEVRSFLTVDGELRDAVERPRLAAAVDALQAHISETYRLHRRMIRHRRAKVLMRSDDSEIAPFEVRGRRRPHSLPLGSAQQQAIDEALLDWQAEMSTWLLDHPEDGTFTDLGRALAVLVSRAGGSVTDLIDALRWRVERDAGAADRAFLSLDERIALATPVIQPIERRLLDELSGAFSGSASGHVHLAEVIAPVVGKARHAVVFSGPGSLCAELCSALIDRGADPHVLEHSRRVGREMSEQAVRFWREKGGILIVDSTGEAGLNLQEADAVIHCRLPASPNRLEQVIGRVDRYSQDPGKPARQYVIVGTNSDLGFCSAWLTLLDQGFDIFRESVSALQDAIDGALPWVWQSAAENGPEGLLTIREKVVDLLKQERKEVDAMDMLESIHDSPADLRDIAAAINTFESQEWRDFEAALVGYAGSSPGGLRFVVRRRGSDYHPVVEFELGGKPPLMPPRMFTLAGHRIQPTQMQGLFSRTAMLRRPGTRLFRIGQPFVDLLAQVVTIDDRGQAAVLFRPARLRSPEPQVYVRFDYLVEADLTAVLSMTGGQGDVELALRRQADRILAPFLRHVWLAANGRAVTTPLLLELLERPYDPHRGDVNLNVNRIGPLYDLYGGRAQFALDLQVLQQRSRDELVRVTDLAEVCRKAQHQAMRALASARAQAEARRAAGRLVNDTESRLMEVEVTEALVTGLSTPQISPVSVTVLMVGMCKEISDGSG
ncbi:protein DpdE [Thermopolyspora sp. NPDC052614]|uniref:protein DpdE n=1 Tax=Thermopolyspora sp. NPDC052614 TaxID=3155682 RepID=UPI00341D2BD2